MLLSVVANKIQVIKSTHASIKRWEKNERKIVNGIKSFQLLNTPRRKKKSKPTVYIQFNFSKLYKCKGNIH